VQIGLRKMLEQRHRPKIESSHTVARYR
jgi:hypothetical protein